MHPSPIGGTRQHAWNKGKLVGQKPPLKLKEIGAIRTRPHLLGRLRDLALLNLAVDSKLKACDLVKLRTSDISHGSQIARRAVVLQQNTGGPVQFEITDLARKAALAWIEQARLGFNDFLFPRRSRKGTPISTRHYARLVKAWVSEIELDPAAYGTHSLRRTKASLIYRRTKNLRAVQLLLGYTKLESTVRYLGIEIEDALEVAEQTKI